VAAIALASALYEPSRVSAQPQPSAAQRPRCKALHPAFGDIPALKRQVASEIVKKISDDSTKSQDQLSNGKESEAVGTLSNLRDYLSATHGLCSKSVLVQLGEAQERAAAKDEKNAPELFEAAWDTYGEVAELNRDEEKDPRELKLIDKANERRHALEARKPKIDVEISVPSKDAPPEDPKVLIDEGGRKYLAPVVRLSTGDTVRYTAQVSPAEGRPHRVLVSAPGYYATPVEQTIDVQRWKTYTASFALEQISSAGAAKGPPRDALSALSAQQKESFATFFDAAHEQLAKLGEVTGPRAESEERLRKALGGFQQAHRMAATSSGAFNIAQCYAGLGEDAQAFHKYREATVLGSKDQVGLPNPLLATSKDLTERASSKVSEMKERVASVCVSIRGKVTSLLVDGKPVDLGSKLRLANKEDVLGKDGTTPLCTSDEEYTVDLDAGGGEPRPPSGPFWLVVEGRNKSHSIQARGEAGPIEPAPTLEPGQRVLVIDADAGHPPPRSAWAIAGGTAMGAAAVSFAVGSAFAVKARSAFSNAAPLCPENMCPPNVYANVETGRDYGNAATGLFVAGGALLVGGAVAIIHWRSTGAQSDPSTPKLDGAIGPGGGRLSITGTFQ
jgi:hypothetical protein